MEVKKSRIILVINLFLLFSLFFSGWALAEKTPRVLILPFNIHSDKDLSFLKDGITDMLTSRLTQEGKVLPLTREETQEVTKEMAGPVTEKTAVSLAEKFGAAYVVFGSLTVFGESISTDARFFDVAQEKALLTFYESGKDNSDVISHVSIFAARINEEVFGEQGADLPGDRVAAPKKKQVDQSRRHPDAIWAEAQNREETPVGRVPSASPPAIYEQGPSAVVGTVWKSRHFPEALRGVALGDVDNDGKNETVFISERKVFVYRHVQGKFVKLGETEEGTYHALLGADIADINGNGNAEIFVTSVDNDRQKLRSFVLEWDGTTFARIVGDAKWYYRVLDVPDKGRVLLGQEAGMGKPFVPGVYEMKWDGREYVAGDRKAVPRGVNVYGFAYGDIFNDGQERVAAFTGDELIRILGPDGEEEWKSTERFGGSAAYVEFPDEAAASIGNVREMARLYLGQRIIVADPDGDGKNEIIVGKNADITRRIFSRFRMFKSGHIECLAWNNLGFYQKWKTAEISGHVSDYTVGDMNNDGKNELVFSVIVKVPSAFGKAKSFIAFQDFPAPAK